MIASANIFLNTLAGKLILTSLLLLLKIYMFIVCVYLFVHLVHVYGHEGQKRISVALELEEQVVMSHPMWVLRIHPGPLQECS